ncbi:kinase-like protein [Rhizophagus irregularis]|uniref:Kinase-like protein n=1 Tax=Rhizophagus irregularis TaxID=588596 RepID=A0A2N0Q203_9GLOM|nr:kinase-like protein [Rhizophagus irregularis]
MASDSSSKNIDTNKHTRWIENGIAYNYINYHDYNEFENIKFIKRGGFSDVYRATWKNSNTAVALKYIADIGIKDIVNEISLLVKVNNIHVNIIRFFGIAKRHNNDDMNSSYLLIFEYADSGTLGNYLKDNFNKLDWNMKLKFAIQIAYAVSCIHDKDIIHRDLHSDNILVHQNTLRLADFGLSRRLAEVSTQKEIFGKIAYIDPQYCQPKTNKDTIGYEYKPNKKSDVYSVGVLLWEISSGRKPFESYDNGYLRISLMFEILNGKRETPIPGTPNDYINIYTSMTFIICI